MLNGGTPKNGFVPADLSALSAPRTECYNRDKIDPWADLPQISKSIRSTLCGFQNLMKNQ